MRYKIAAVMVFCLVPPLLALAALGRLTVLVMAALGRVGYLRLLAAVLAVWIIVPQLAERGALGTLPLWLHELFSVAYFIAAIGLPILVGYWLFRWSRRRHRADDPVSTGDPGEVPDRKRRRLRNTSR